MTRSASVPISTVPGILQQDQTLPPDRNALRQAGELPRIRSACIHTRWLRVYESTSKSEIKFTEALHSYTGAMISSPPRGSSAPRF
jgi:hypothetical protein